MHFKFGIVWFIALKLLLSEEILTSLDAVNGRKHPNAVQTKQLKGTLPLISIILHLVTSPVSIYYY